MNHRLISWGPFALALAAAALAAPPAPAQSADGPYPYWDSAPSSYNQTGPNLPSPGPAGFPNDLFRPGRPAYGSMSGWTFRGRSWPYSPYGPRRTERRNAPPDDRAHVWLVVPAEAKVWFDGEATKQSGDLRQFSSPALERGKTYTYEVRARWARGGRPVEQTRRVRVHAGASVLLDFTRPAGAPGEAGLSGPPGPGAGATPPAGPGSRPGRPGT